MILPVFGPVLLLWTAGPVLCTGAGGGADPDTGVRALPVSLRANQPKRRHLNIFFHILIVSVHFSWRQNHKKYNGFYFFFAVLAFCQFRSKNIYQ